MKVKSIGSSTKTSTGITTMPNELRDKLNGFTVNEALAAGYIDDLGTPTGKFLVPHKDANIDTFYAIVQGYAIPCSRRVSEAAAAGEIDDDVIGNMKFQKGISTVEGDGFGKAWFNLGMGGVLNLDTESEDAYSLQSEPVNTKK